jgi:hypothetical protein
MSLNATPPQTAEEHENMAARLREMAATYAVSTSAREAALRVADEHDAIAAQIRDDDQLLDRLGSATPGTGPIDDLDAALLGWRDDVEQSSIPELVDVDTAIATIQAGSTS